MSERIVYLNGAYLPESEAKISVFDRGFFWGDGVYDVARTLNHAPYKLREHVERLYRSLRYARIDPGMDPEKMEAVSREVVERNRPRWAPHEYHRICQHVTRGPQAYTGSGDVHTPRATVLVHCAGLDWPRMAKGYREGIRLATPSIRQRPSEYLDPRVKSTSKLGHIMAEMEARQAGADAALLLDQDGFVTEGISANFFFVERGTLVTPPMLETLAGVTGTTLIELAADLGIPVRQRIFAPYDVYAGDEAFLASTGFFLMPVSHLNGYRIGSETPGPLTLRLLKAWGDKVGLGIVAQAEKNASMSGEAP